MWTEYVVKPFSGNDTGKHRSKQAALEDAQSRAIANPGEDFTVYRANHFTVNDEISPHTLTLTPLITYYYDKFIRKLQWEREV